MEDVEDDRKTLCYSEKKYKMFDLVEENHVEKLSLEEEELLQKVTETNTQVYVSEIIKKIEIFQKKHGYYVQLYDFVNRSASEEFPPLQITEILQEVLLSVVNDDQILNPPLPIYCKFFMKLNYKKLSSCGLKILNLILDFKNSLKNEFDRSLLPYRESFESLPHEENDSGRMDIFEDYKYFCDYLVLQIPNFEREILLVREIIHDIYELLFVSSTVRVSRNSFPKLLVILHYFIHKVCSLQKCAKHLYLLFMQLKIIYLKLESSEYQKKEDLSHTEENSD